MSKTSLLLLLCLASMTYGVTRPPVPTNVPFSYDPNLCLSPVMDWIVVEPNYSLVYAVGVHNTYGLKVEVEVYGPNVTSVDILVQDIGTVADPNGGINQYFQIGWSPPVGEMVHYLELRASDLAGREDRRTLLVYVAEDDVPFLFPVKSLPVAHIRSAQRFVQYAKKMGFPLTGRVAVR